MKREAIFVSALLNLSLMYIDTIVVETPSEESAVIHVRPILSQCGATRASKINHTLIFIAIPL